MNPIIKELHLRGMGTDAEAWIKRQGGMKVYAAEIPAQMVNGEGRGTIGILFNPQTGTIGVAMVSEEERREELSGGKAAEISPPAAAPNPPANLTSETETDAP